MISLSNSVLHLSVVIPRPYLFVSVSSTIQEGHPILFLRPVHHTLFNYVCVYNSIWYCCHCIVIVKGPLPEIVNNRHENHSVAKEWLCWVIFLFFCEHQLGLLNSNFDISHYCWQEIIETDI